MSVIDADDLSRHIRYDNGRLLVDEQFKWEFVKTVLQEALSAHKGGLSEWQIVLNVVNIPLKIRQTLINRKYESIILDLLGEKNAVFANISNKLLSAEVDDFELSLIKRSLAEQINRKLEGIVKAYTREYNALSHLGVDS